MLTVSEEQSVIYHHTWLHARRLHLVDNLSCSGQLSPLGQGVYKDTIRGGVLTEAGIPLHSLEHPFGLSQVPCSGVGLHQHRVALPARCYRASLHLGQPALGDRSRIIRAGLQDEVEAVLRRPLTTLTPHPLKPSLRLLAVSLLCPRLEHRLEAANILLLPASHASLLLQIDTVARCAAPHLIASSLRQEQQHLASYKLRRHSTGSPSGCIKHHGS
mmetsp:Transcript_2573/g.5961  ORF Transcript_2573/g.5961 Transcript_2573/m.5961 type:complete len:216 (-) Transcript_2573:33-680(-)